LYDITLKEEQIILDGITTNPRLCGKKYIIYHALSGKSESVFINTYFLRTSGGLYQCCSHYGHELCSSTEELRHMGIGDIEAAAYNAWMTGAR